MAKKKENLTEEKVDTEVDQKVETKDSKSEVKNKEKNKGKQVKKKKEKRGLGKKIKETASELKKVSWPTFGKVVKSTVVVLVVVLCCTIVLFGIDYLLKFPFNWLTNNG